MPEAELEKRPQKEPQEERGWFGRIIVAFKDALINSAFFIGGTYAASRVTNIKQLDFFGVGDVVDAKTEEDRKKAMESLANSAALSVGSGTLLKVAMPALLGGAVQASTATAPTNLPPVPASHLQAKGHGN